MAGRAVATATRELDSANPYVKATALRDLVLRDATDSAIFDAAKKANAVLISKDSDFVELVMRHGAPPKLIWLTCDLWERELRCIANAIQRQAA